MSYVLGFDVSKAKLDFSLVDGNGVEQWFGSIPNTVPDAAMVMFTASGNIPYDPGTIGALTCAVESTGCYHHPVLAAAQTAGLSCRVQNPITTKQQLRATIRGTKTDRTDALMVARSGLRGEGRIYTPEPYADSKYYGRVQQRLGTVATAVKRYERHLCDVLESPMIDELSQLFTQVHIDLQRLRQALARAQQAVLPAELSTLLQTIPGVGPAVAGSVVGEIQAIERFRTGKTIIAYAGLDPKVKQSGRTLNSTGRLTKRGSPYLRRNIFIAASVARQHDARFKALYEKKRGEGKSYTVAVCAVSRVLLKTIRAVWLNGKVYTIKLGTETRSEASNTQAHR